MIASSAWGRTQSYSLCCVLKRTERPIVAVPENKKRRPEGHPIGGMLTAHFGGVVALTLDLF